jgi:flagellar M-ring protein FliF
MDFLNKSLAQLSELFRSMTPGARITAGLLLAVVVVSLGYLFRQSTTGPDAFLFGGQALSDGELNRIEAALGRANVTWVRENNRVRVPSGQQTTALGAIADADALPMNFNTILEDSLGKGGPWESSAAQRERQKIAKQGALTDMIRAMPWVEEAMVLYDEQPPQGLSRAKLVTGSVSVRPVLGEVLDARRIKMLQKLVASSLVGMKPEDVAVTDLGESSGAFGSSGSAIDLIDDEYYLTKIAFETQRKEAILNVLRDIPGVRVEVNAELDDIKEEITTNVKPDKTSSAPSRTVTINDSTESTTSKGGGQPGPVAQGPTRQGASESPPQNNNVVKSSTETEETDNVVSVEQSKTVRTSFTPKSIIATVMIPTSYLQKVWKARNPDATDPPKPEDLVQLEATTKTKIEYLVEPYVMLQANRLEDTFKYVKVEFLDTLPQPTIEPPSTTSKAMAWAGRYWSTLAMLGVAMFSLLIMRSVVKGVPAPTGAAANAVPALTLHSDETASRENSDADGEEPEEDRPRLRLKKGKSLKDDLVEIVHEDPDAAAEILRSWIGKVA